MSQQVASVTAFAVFLVSIGLSSAAKVERYWGVLAATVCVMVLTAIAEIVDLARRHRPN